MIALWYFCNEFQYLEWIFMLEIFIAYNLEFHSLQSILTIIVLKSKPYKLKPSLTLIGLGLAKAWPEIWPLANVFEWPDLTQATFL